MNRKYDHSAYCSHCQRWILRTNLVFDNSGYEKCPYCHGRVRMKRHLHDLPRKPHVVLDEVTEKPDTVDRHFGEQYS